MKAFLYACLLLFVGALWPAQVGAQVNGESRMGNGGPYWILGLNGGAAWQDSDIKARLGGGWGFYFGHSLYNKPNSFFSVDWRFRYMNTYTFGQNARDTRFGNSILSDPNQFSYRPDSGAFAHNHFTAFHDLSLEVRLNFEELRRRYKVLFSVYGGVGLGIYGSKFDQLDFDGDEYDYADVDYTQGDRAIRRDIINFRDGEYETFAATDDFRDNLFRVGIMPSVGVELGYWFTPYFALAIGHRTTFTLQENFEGVSINNNKEIEGSIHHYTSLMLHWRLATGRARVSCPEINFVAPAGNGQQVNTNQSSAFIKANVSHLSSNQVTVTVNGRTVNSVVFNSAASTVEGNIRLSVGENRVVVKGKNACGTEAQAVRVIYNAGGNNNTNTNTTTNNPNNTNTTITSPPTSRPPIVSFTNPARTPSSTRANLYNITAQVQHVAGRDGLTFTVNGQNYTNFTFSGTNFRANGVNLSPGQNVFTLTARNRDGNDSKTVVINFEQPNPRPIVTITSPSSNPYITQNNRATVTATIQHVNDVRNVNCTINGRATNAFTFNGTAFTLANVALNAGNNTVIITGTNNAGQDSKSVTISYEPVVQTPRPVVTITQPNANPFNTNNPRLDLRASILNVDNARDITFTHNGRTVTNFSFSRTSFVASNIILAAGNNTFVLTARNRAGQDSRSTLVIFQKQEPEPSVVITTPNRNPSTTNNATVDVRATINNVAGRNNVSMTVNGRANTNFSFSGNTFTANNVSLVQGNNTIIINGSNSQGTATASTTVIYQVQEPEPSVVITSPSNNPSSTAAATANIRATINNVAGRNNVSMTVNGRANTSFSFSGTAFVANNVALNPGNNTIVISGSNSQGVATASTTIIYELGAPPVVQFTSPNVNPLTITQNSINIRANITNVDNKNDVAFTINGRATTNFTFSNGQLQANGVELNLGSNTFVVTGRNNAGQDSKTTVVVYRQAIQPPTVNITIPNRNPSSTTNASLNLSAVITNIASSRGVTFTINGSRTNKFTLTGTSFTATNIGLNPGRNTLAITATNEAGSDSKSTVVIYEMPVQEPAVTITTPNSNPHTTQQTTANIAATIVNVNGRNNVQFKINGQVSSKFDFAGTSFTANNVPLRTGNNTIMISGSNSEGTATATTVIIHQPPLKKPAVRILVPNTNPATVMTNTVNITANVQYVASKNDMSFVVNGQASNNFSLSGNTFTANNVNLRTGNNNIEIVGRNAAGQASASTVVVYQAPKPPRITITVPNQNPLTTTNQRVNVNATILEVSGRGDVRFQVNGQNNTDFNFSGTQFTALNLQLRPGSNTITIQAGNSQGRDSKTTTVIYEPPVQEPAVTITSPSSNPFNTQVNNITINATILNVAQRSEVGFKVNGQTVTNFQFSGTSFTASNVPLQSGNNTFVVTGSNSSGTATASTTVIYTPFVPRPTVSITTPSSNPTTVSTATTTVRATIQNVSNRGNISLTVNGRAVNNFLFSGTTLQANGVSLNPGNNNIVLTATNTAGAASDSKVVIFMSRTTGGTTGGNTGQTGSGSSGGGNTGNTGGSSGGSSGSSGKKIDSSTKTQSSTRSGARTTPSTTKKGGSTKSGSSQKSSSTKESSTKKEGTTTKESTTKKGGTK